MRKSIFAVCLLAMFLFSGSALADYNKNYDDPTGDVIKIGDILESSIDITNVKTTDVGDSVRFELTVTGPIEADSNHIYFLNLGDFDYEALIEGTFWGLMYYQGIGMLVQPSGSFAMVTVWIDENTLNVTVEKSKLPASEDFDVTAFTLYASGDMNPESMDFCPMIEVDMDMDNDGMGDAWEVEFFGDLDETAGGDADGDGCSNLNEFNNGTDPTDANECVPSEDGEAAFLGLALYLWIIIIVIIVAVIVVIAVAVHQRSKTRRMPPPPGEMPPPPPGYPPSE